MQYKYYNRWAYFQEESHSKREFGFLEGEPTIFSSFVFVSIANNPTGQITLNASIDQQLPPEDSPEVAINVIEGGSVTFRCQAITPNPVLNIRPPRNSAFGTTLPPNLRIIDSLTYEFQNVSRSDIGTAFQCRRGASFTDIGVIIVLRK